MTLLIVIAIVTFHGCVVVHGCLGEVYVKNSTIKCFWELAKEYTQSEANSECQRSGGILATIEDAEQSDFVVQKFNGTSNQDLLWVGMVFSNNTWSNSIGEPLTWVNWGEKTPDHDTCFQLMVGKREWINQDCTASHHALCEISAYVCEDDLEDDCPKCFWVDLTKLTHELADQRCAENGGRLATIGSQQQSDFILVNTLRGLIYLGPYWIGVKRNEFGAWVSVSGILSWLNWSYRDTQASNCSRAMKTVNLQWITTDCERMAPFLCESQCGNYDMLETTTTTATETMHYNVTDKTRGKGESTSTPVTEVPQTSAVGNVTKQTGDSQVSTTSLSTTSETAKRDIDYKIPKLRRCQLPVSCTMEAKKEQPIGLEKITRRETSRNRRKFYSANDPRMSVAFIGVTFLCLCFMIYLVVFLSDIRSIWRMFWYGKSD